MPEQSPFIWHELVTPDQKSSGTFFSQLFGWKRKEVDAGSFGTYTLFQKNGQDVAGMMNPTPDTTGKGSYWHSYVGGRRGMRQASPFARWKRRRPAA